MDEIVNCFTVDLEPWMCYYDQPSLEKELDNNLTTQLTHRILDLLERKNIRATFFVLGKIYGWYPRLIEEIAQRGHEIAFHTYTHRKITSREVLLDEIEKARKFIKKYKPRGFRAPQMILPPSSLSILHSYGFIYDSSTYASIGKPIKIINGNNVIIEVPVTTYPLLKKKGEFNLPRTLIQAIKNFELPVGSGLLIGLLSSRILNRIIKKFNNEKKSFIMFIHPWQLYNVSRLHITLRKQLLKLPYRVKISEEKLNDILSQHYFTTMMDLIKAYLREGIINDCS